MDINVDQQKQSFEWKSHANRHYQKKKSIASIVLTYWFGTVPLRTGAGGGRRGRCIIKSLSILLAHGIHTICSDINNGETYRMHHSITPRIRSKKATNG